MSDSKLYRVFKLKCTLEMQDPDMSGPRFHTVIFVETNGQGPGSGVKHHVTGDLVQGMQYEAEPYDNPESFENFAAMELIGYTKADTYPEKWDDHLKAIPPPPKQKAFNIRTMKTEPVKSWDPLVFYEPGEARVPLIKCTEWAEQQAIPSLISDGLIETRKLS
ncbi:hypothetical protein QQZ08_009475 [Neonectria magnoliae]|uniref:Uncharacterized protein n=1 Tax=Neonectria magnoliae TaxID=2732573 RepID=A0ABR1HMW8_9HYPO